MIVDRYLGRKFDWHTMNCVTLVNEVWKDLTGVDLQLTNPPTWQLGDCTQHHGRMMQRLLDTGVIREVWVPEEPCIVSFYARAKYPHLAVFIEGAMLHATPGRGSVHEVLPPELLVGPMKARFGVHQCHSALKQ